MAISKRASQHPYNMNDCIEMDIEDGPAEQVSNFYSQGANISGDTMTDRDLEIRGGQGGVR